MQPEVTDMSPKISLAALLLACACATAQAPPRQLTVLSAGAVKTAFTAASGSWEQRTGNTITATYAPAGELRKRVAAGEVSDVIIVPAENFAELEHAGAVDVATRRDLGAVGIGVAVRKGAKPVDISTPDSLRRTLTEAKSLTYMDPARGTSGKHVDEMVLPTLGIRDAVRAKTQLGEGGFIAEKVARGEVELAIHQMTEMLPVAGVTIVGPLPASLQKTTIYTGAVMKGARNPAEARALLDYLASADGRRFFLERGFAAP
jgi:molybdate transport system substrate-binding protein